MKIVPLVLFLTLSFSALSQSVQSKKEIYGEYYYRHASVAIIHSIKLTLYTDSSFEYHDRNCMSHRFSSGTWKRRNHSLVLNSTLLQRDIPVSITEQVADTPTNGSIWLEFIGSWGYYNFNGDTIKKYATEIDDSWSMPVGSIDSLRVQLGNESCTRWYKVHDKQSRHIRVQSGTKEDTYTYLFFVNARYRFTGNGLLFLGDGVIEYHRGKNVRVKLALQKTEATNDDNG